MPMTLTCPSCSDEDRDIPAGVARFWCSSCSSPWSRAETVGDAMRTLRTLLDEGAVAEARDIAATVSASYFDLPLDPMATAV